MFSYTFGKAGSDSLNFDSDPFVIITGAGTTNDPYRYDDYSFKNVNDIDELSDLEYTTWEASATATYNITDALGLSVNYKYQDYQDDQEYVYGDTSGKTQSIAGFLTFRF